MHQTRDGLPYPKNRRGLWPAACALTLVLALASPGTAVAASVPTPSSDLTRPDALAAWGSGRAGAHGSSLVRVVQRSLAAAGYAPGPIDGQFGLLTWRAVLAFQASRGLQVDGIVGPQTWGALSRSSQALSLGAGSGPAGWQRVRELQRRLALTGYSPGPIDGHYGPLTEGAVRRFQATHGLPANGVAGPQTLARVAEPERSEQSSRRPSPGAASRANGPVEQSPTSTAVKRPSNGSSASGTAAWVILLALGLALIVVALRHARRRIGDRFSPVPRSAALGDVNHTNGAGRPGQTAAVTEPDSSLEHDDAPAAQTDAPLPDYDARAAFELGVLLEERGELDAAEAAYRRADRGGHGPAASNLGVLLEERGAPAQAEAAYRRADERGDATAAFNLGVLLEERGELHVAEQAYRRADQRGAGNVANLARAALLDLREGARQPSANGGRSR